MSKKMTREKAIEVLDKMPFCNECDATFPFYCNECEEAFLMAIEALKQPEIIRCKDCKNQDDLRYEVGGKFVCRKGHGWNPDDWYCADGEPKEGENDA